MMNISFDSFESGNLDTFKTEVIEGFKAFNKAFTTMVKPESGVYGTTEVSKGPGLLERTIKTENGYNKEYYYNEKLYCTRTCFKNETLIGDNIRTVITKKMDDIGTPYTQQISKFGSKGLIESSLELIPNTEIIKDNFSAIIDEYGRPVINKITDLKIKEVDEARKNLSKSLKDGTYKAGDERGHLIADRFGGPNTKENIVPQSFNVNRKEMAQLERYIQKIKEENPNSKIDFNIKSNYAGTGKRPTSFEPEVFIDGVKQKFIGENENLEKIFNIKEGGDLYKKINSKLDNKLDVISKAKINLGEKYGFQHEAGMKDGLVAATITMAVSTVDNFSSFMDGEITAEEMVMDIAKDTGTAGLVGYGTGFITKTIAMEMSSSSSQLLNKLGGSGVPGALVSFGVQSYESIADFAQGKIDTVELAYDLGNNATNVTGGYYGMLVGAKVGAMVGSVVPGAGTTVGTFVGGFVGATAGSEVGSKVYETTADYLSKNIDTVVDVAGDAMNTMSTVASPMTNMVGNMVNLAITSEAYNSALETGTKGVEIIGEKAQSFADKTVEFAKVGIPNQVEGIKESINVYAKQWNLPVQV